MKKIIRQLNAEQKREMYFSKLLQNIKQRCQYPKDKKYKYYGGRGIECHITKEQLKYLWKRDKGHLLKQPSIDRKNNKGHYKVRNCRFIEMDANRRKRKWKESWTRT